MLRRGVEDAAERHLPAPVAPPHRRPRRAPGQRLARRRRTRPTGRAPATPARSSRFASPGRGWRRSGGPARPGRSGDRRGEQHRPAADSQQHPVERRRQRIVRQVRPGAVRGIEDTIRMLARLVAHGVGDDRPADGGEPRASASSTASATAASDRSPAGRPGTRRVSGGTCDDIAQT